MDTGGVNLKGAAGMKNMKRDMCGAGACLGAAVALARLATSCAADLEETGTSSSSPEVPAALQRPIECFLAVTDNLIGPDAYRPDDVAMACDGTTIEMVHTDAEGRLALADALALASRKVPWPGKAPSANPSTSDSSTSPETAPALVVDMATLTGTMITSLSRRYSGAFSSKLQDPSTMPSTMQAIVAAGIASGERLWPFPLDPDFSEALSSNVADTLQCTVAVEADHIFAAAFLQRFVREEVPWLHLDLAAAAGTGGLAHVSGDGPTGFGVRCAVWAVLDWWESLAAAGPTDGVPDADNGPLVDDSDMDMDER